MPSLLLTIFLLQLFIHILNSISTETLVELLWQLTARLPILPHHQTARDARATRREALQLKRDLNHISAQDDFARWAKLRRQHDKKMEECEKLETTLHTHRARLQTLITALRFLLTMLARWGVQIWYARAAVFWLPAGWVPGYVEWAVGFPRAPRGAVGVQVWSLACAAVVRLMAEGVGAVWGLVWGVEGGKGMGEGKMGEKVGMEGREGGKKEL